MIKKKLESVISLLGFDVARFKALRNFARFLDELKNFKRNLDRVEDFKIKPILHDYDDFAGSSRGHYFHQDLLVATMIYNRVPERHIDIGSRIDGFVAHVASFRKIEVFDIRSLGDIGHDNIVFYQQDVMQEDFELCEIADSVSCLHALEHFGLGRYGDQINPQAHKIAFRKMLSMLTPGGYLYLSVPLGSKNTTFFNAERVFTSDEPLSWIQSLQGVSLNRFDFVDDDGRLHSKIPWNSLVVGNCTYGCGIYTFKKEQSIKHRLAET